MLMRIIKLLLGKIMGIFKNSVGEDFVIVDKVRDLPAHPERT